MPIITALVAGFLLGAIAIIAFAALVISDTSPDRKEAAFYKKHAEDWEGLAMEYKQIAFKLAKKNSAPPEQQKILENLYNEGVAASLASEQKEQKKDLESRIYEILDKEYLGKTFPVVGMSDLAQIGVTFSKAYFEEVGELPPGTTLKSKVWKYAITRKIAPMEFYVHQFF